MNSNEMEQFGIECMYTDLKFGSLFSRSPISEPMSEVDPVEPTEPLFRSELEFWRDREVELARLPGREVLGVRVVDGVRLDCK